MSDFEYVLKEKVSSGKTTKYILLEYNVSTLNHIEVYWFLTLTRIKKLMEINHAHCVEGQLPLPGLYESKFGLNRL